MRPTHPLWTDVHSVDAALLCGCQGNVLAEPGVARLGLGPAGRVRLLRRLVLLLDHPAQTWRTGTVGDMGDSRGHQGHQETPEDTRGYQETQGDTRTQQETQQG